MNKRIHLDEDGHPIEGAEEAERHTNTRDLEDGEFCYCARCMADSWEPYEA